MQHSNTTDPSPNPYPTLTTEQLNNVYKKTINQSFSVDFDNLFSWREAKVWMPDYLGYLYYQKVLLNPYDCCDACLPILRDYCVMTGCVFSSHQNWHCSHYFEVQGKSKSNSRYAHTKAKRIRKLNVVYDFGNCYNLKEPTDINNLLLNIDTWLWSARLPSDVVHLRRFAESWSAQAHRKLALSILMSQGHPVASLLMSAMSGKLTQVRRDSWNLNQAQYFTTFMEVAWLFITLYVLYKGYENRDKLDRLFGAALTLNTSVVKTSDAVSSMLSTVTDIGDSVMSACRATLNFFNDLIESVINKFKELPLIMRDLLLMMGKAILIFMAFEFARTMFSKHYPHIRQWLCDHFKFENTVEEHAGFTAQSNGEDETSVLDDVLEFFCINFVRRPKKLFVEYLGDLPKIVSIAKALEWITEHLGFLYNAVLEIWTGEPRPKTKIEMEIMSLSILVTEVTAALSSATSEELYSESMMLRVEALDMEQKRLSVIITKNEKLRQVFISRYLQAAQELEKMKANFKLQRKSAQPRPVPVWCYIYGEPGIGKSHCCATLYRMIWSYLRDYGGTMVEGEFHNGHLYYLNQLEDFSDGYQGQLFTVIDDLFQATKPDDRSAVAQRLIHMISPEPYSLRVADMKEKAHTFFTSRAIISTSNLEPNFAGQNLGLIDVGALEGRVSIAVELTDGGFVPYRKLSSISFGENEKQTHFTLEEIAAVIGEAILKREAEKQYVHPAYSIPRFVGKLESKRLKFEGQGLTGKEKMTEEDVRAEKYAASIYLSCLNWGFSQEESHKIALGYCSWFEPGISSPMTDEEVVKCSQKYGMAPRAPSETYSDYHDKVVQKLLVEYGSTLHSSLSAKIRATGMTQKSSESFRDFYGRVNYEEERQDRLLRAHNRKKFAKVDHKPTFMERLKDPKGTCKTFFDSLVWYLSKVGDSTWIDAGTVRVFACTQPGAILPPTTGARPTNMNEWIDSLLEENRFLYWGLNPSLDFEYWLPVAISLKEHFNRTFPNPDSSEAKFFFEAQYTQAEQRPSMGAMMLSSAIWALVLGFVLTKIILCMMPSTAHENRMEPQASYDGSGGKTKKTKPVLRRTNRKVTKFDKDKRAQQKSYSAQGQGSVVADKITSNSEVIETRVSDGDAQWDEVSTYEPVASSYCLFVYGNYALVPGHVMFALGEGKKRWFSLIKNQTYVVAEEEIKFIKELRGDVFLVQFPDIADHSNILGLFADNVDDFGTFNHIVPHLKDSGHDLVSAWGWDNEFETVYIRDYEFETDLRFMGVPNQKGMCGTPYVHRTTGKIVAIHMGGNPSQEITLATSVIKEDLVEFDPRISIIEPIPHIRTEAQSLAGVQVLGQLPRNAGSFVPMTSTMRISKFDYHSLPIAETEDGPAALAPFNRDGIRVSPLHIALNKFSLQYRVPCPASPQNLSDLLPKTFKPKNVRPITIEESVFGIPSYLKSIDFNTSSGYFFKKQGLSRRDLCYKDGLPFIHPLLREEVEKRIYAASKGIIYPVVFEETLKDEIRSKEKNDKGETRLFSAGDFASFIAQRMYLGTFVVEFMKDPVGSPVGLSINPHSADWGRLYNRLKGRPDELRRIGAGDFTNYDISLKNQLLALFIKLVESYYSEEYRVTVIFLIKANFSGWHIVGVIVFLRPWGTCSGSFITAVFNTFCNWCLHKMAFIALYSEEDFVHCETTFTGDDSVFSVPEKYDKYNMAYLEDFFRKSFGMRYTSPTKTSEMTVEWEDLVYLKRKFVRGHMGMMAPLATRSLSNMIKWTDVDQDRVVLQSVLTSLLLESWHHGESFYHDTYFWTVDEAKRLGIAFDIPTFQSMTFMREPDY